MAMTVWVDDWRVQCCGQSFAPGDVVSWTLDADGRAKARPDVRFAGYLVTARPAADAPDGAATRSR